MRWQQAAQKWALACGHTPAKLWAEKTLYLHSVCQVVLEEAKHVYKESNSRPLVFYGTQFK